MKELKLKIVINKPVSEVFEFTINPKNTPLWVNTIIKEETNEYPVKNGTIYKNTGDKINWSEYLISGFEKDKSFIFNQINGDYHVKYDFKEITDGKTEVEYYEWVDKGELTTPFTIEELTKLKIAVEK
jgi:hypothetical protein